MARAARVTTINRAAIQDAADAMALVPLPPIDWFVRGPRGGLYIATGERERYITENGDDWARNTLSVVDKSKGLKYVRPGSRLAREAVVE